jgi:hypothetical protein
MASNGTGNSHSVSTEELLAAAGIVVTEEGRARARAELDAAGAWYAAADRKAQFWEQVRRRRNAA